MFDDWKKLSSRFEKIRVFWHSSIACQIRQNQAKPNLKAIAQILPQIHKYQNPSPPLAVPHILYFIVYIQCCVGCAAVDDIVP